MSVMTAIFDPVKSAIRHFESYKKVMDALIAILVAYGVADLFYPGRLPWWVIHEAFFVMAALIWVCKTVVISLHDSFDNAS
jgi:hypothetical protein